MQLVIHEHKIARDKVIPLDIKDQEPSKIKGGSIFSEPYANIYLVSRKKSGKTWVIGTILDKCADKNTIVYLFVSTHLRDDAWIQIKEKLEGKGITVVPFTSIKEGQTNYLTEIIRELDEEKEKEDDEKKQREVEGEVRKSSEKIPQSMLKIINIGDFEPVKSLIRTGDEEIEQKEKKRKAKKPKKLAPEIIFVFDDMADQLRGPAIAALLKKNRHYKCKVIISTQYLKDTKPESRRNIDYWIVFGGIPDDKLDTIYSDADLSIDKEAFKAIYTQVTSKKHDFLFIDCVNDQFRRNFDKLLTIEEQ